MEVVLLIGLALVVPIILWRARRGTTSWRESPNAWKGDRNPARYDIKDSREQDYASIADWRPTPVSREDGHGKDGGG